MQTLKRFLVIFAFFWINISLWTLLASEGSKRVPEESFRMMFHFCLLVFHFQLLIGMQTKRADLLRNTYHLGFLCFLIYMSGTLKSALEEVSMYTGWYLALIVAYHILCFIFGLIYLNLILLYIINVEKKAVDRLQQRMDRFERSQEMYAYVPESSPRSPSGVTQSSQSPSRKVTFISMLLFRRSQTTF